MGGDWRLGLGEAATGGVGVSRLPRPNLLRKPTVAGAGSARRGGGLVGERRASYVVWKRQAMKIGRDAISEDEEDVGG